MVDVKPRRRYDSRRRRAQATQTRQDILSAARIVFLERGYTGATMATIARTADVVVETIYRTGVVRLVSAAGAEDDRNG